MPLEVTPPPFSASQRLPYTPAFARVEIPGAPGTSSIGGAGGPASAAASAIIPPAPGGVADPHHAIPALPEAGYTAPTLRPASISIDPRYAGSVYGGASVYGGPGPRGPPSSAYGYEHPPAQAHQHQHVHSPLSVVHTEGWSASSLPSPKRRPPLPSVADSVIAPRSHHHHRSDHRHSDHHHVHHDFDDGKSDANYYALPKIQKPRSRSGSVSPASDSSGPKDIATPHHRSRSFSGVHHHHRSPSLPPVGHLHSPISPSPLAAAGSGGMIGRSPLSPNNLEPSQRQRERASPAPEEERRQRLHSYVPTDLEDQETEQDRRRERRHSALPHEAERHRNDSGRLSHHGQGGHHRHRSGSHLPPPPPSDHSYSSSYRPLSPTGGGALGLHLHPDTASAGGRRRAHSMQGLDRPYNINSYQAPSVAGPGNATVYDDGASLISNSRMTFMDGSVAGRTSQYGLPKYPHQPKMDYRRFCVQRGNADVFLD